MAQKKDNWFSRTISNLKKVIVGGAIVAGPAYYHYGTETTKTVTVREIETTWEDGEKHITLRTDKGSFRNEKSIFHMKDNEDAKDLTAIFDKGKTYKITSYGEIDGKVPLWKRNITDAVEATRFETFEIISGGQKVVIKAPAESEKLIKIESITPIPKKTTEPRDSL